MITLILKKTKLKKLWCRFCINKLVFFFFFDSHIWMFIYDDMRDNDAILWKINSLCITSLGQKRTQIQEHTPSVSLSKSLAAAVAAPSSPRHWPLTSCFGLKHQTLGLSLRLVVDAEHPVAGGQDKMTRHAGGVVMPTTDRGWGSVECMWASEITSLLFSASYFITWASFSLSSTLCWNKMTKPSTVVFLTLCFVQSCCQTGWSPKPWILEPKEDRFSLDQRPSCFWSSSCFYLWICLFVRFCSF